MSDDRYRTGMPRTLGLFIPFVIGIGLPYISWGHGLGTYPNPQLVTLAVEPLRNRYGFAESIDIECRLTNSSSHVQYVASMEPQVEVASPTRLRVNLTILDKAAAERAFVFPYPDVIRVEPGKTHRWSIRIAMPIVRRSNAYGPADVISELWLAGSVNVVAVAGLGATKFVKDGRLGPDGGFFGWQRMVVSPPASVFVELPRPGTVLRYDWIPDHLSVPMRIRRRVGKGEGM